MEGDGPSTPSKNAVNLAIESDLASPLPLCAKPRLYFSSGKGRQETQRLVGAAKGGSLHGIILRQAPSISNLSDAIVTLLALTVCLGVATLSWHFFERPIVQYGQRILYRG